MLSIAEELACKFSHLFFFYLPKFPIHWSADHTHLVYTIPRYRWYPWFFAMFDVFLVGSHCFILLMLHYLGHPFPGFSKEVLIIQTFCGLLLVAMAIISKKVYQHGGPVMLGANVIFRFCKNVEQKYFQHYRTAYWLKARESRESTFLIFLSFAMPVVPFLITLVCLTLDLDCIHFLLERFFLTSPSWLRSSKEINLAIFFRLAVLFHVSSETTRTLIHFIITLQIFVTRTRRVLILLSKEINLTRFDQLYRQFYLAHFSVQSCFNDCFMVILQGLFLLTVEDLWMLCKGYGKVSPGIYLLFLLFGGTLIGATACILPMIIRSNVLCNDLLNYRKKQAEFRWIKRRTMGRLVEYMKIRSLQPIKISSGSLYHMNEKTSIVYLTNLNLRWVDSMLLFRL